MTKGVKVRLNLKSLRNALRKQIINEQTERLVAYARDELFEMILTRDFHSRTYNLADSYVYAVYFDGKEQKHGFVGGKKASKPSLLHEWSSDPSKRIPVEGRKEANAFLQSYSMHVPKDGWVVVWAACAPYARYLDPSAGSSKTNRFFVISQRYDHIRDTFGKKGKVIFKVA